MRPSGSKATVLTAPTAPAGLPTRRWEARSQSRTPVVPAVASVRPSRLDAMASRSPDCVSARPIWLRARTSQSRAAPSTPTDTNVPPPAVKARPRTQLP
jgi:hypothetical protein